MSRSSLTHRLLKDISVASWFGKYEQSRCEAPRAGPAWTSAGRLRGVRPRSATAAPWRERLALRGAETRLRTAAALPTPAGRRLLTRSAPTCAAQVTCLSARTIRPFVFFFPFDSPLPPFLIGSFSYCGVLRVLCTSGMQVLCQIPFRVFHCLNGQSYF